jgi:hypothetical protein
MRARRFLLCVTSASRGSLGAGWAVRLGLRRDHHHVTVVERLTCLAGPISPV